MVEYQPAWITEELHQYLERIGGHNQRKKRTTVLRLAEARATGVRTETETFRLPDVCSKPCWYGKYKDGEQLPGWRDDPAISDALEAATQRALWWQDQAEARRIAKRQDDVAKARDKLCELSWPAVLKLGALLGADSVETARKAANDILDRADEALASKAAIYEKAENVQRISFDLDGLPTEILQAIVDEGDQAGALGEREGGTE